MHPKFDACFVLAIIEFGMNCLAQIAMALAMHSIASDKFLHLNFKFFLCMALSPTLLNFIRRSVANYLTLFSIYDLSTEFLAIYSCASIFSTILLSIIMPVVAVERMLCTYSVANYERRRVAASSLSICTIIVVFVAICVTFCANSIVSMACQLASPIFTLILLWWVYRANHRRRRLHRSISLEDKSLAIQNMNSVRLFLPPMTCSSLFSILHDGRENVGNEVTATRVSNSSGALTLGKFVALSEEFEYTESVLNAIVGITIALDDLLTPSIAFVCHRLLKSRSLRIHSQLRNMSPASADYFKQFDKAWKLSDPKE